MRYRGGKETTGVYKGRRVITAIYHGARLVWELISSCFGKGYWINNAPYVNEDMWKNE
jgi:hypothetical protein